MKKTRARTAAAGTPSKDATVGEFLAQLDHPLKPEIEAVRQTILASDPAIEEEVKWNAPSFRTTEFFATFHLRKEDEIQLVFHLGAKVRAEPVELKIDDPKKLAKWLAKDRAVVSLGRGNEVAANREPLQEFVRQWIRFV